MRVSNTFNKKQICDFSQLDKITKNVYSYYAKFFFSISIFHDGALPPVLTRHCFTISETRHLHGVHFEEHLKTTWIPTLIPSLKIKR